MTDDPWPDDLRPEGAPVFTTNRLDIAAPPAAVWPHLVRASAWPEFYGNASDVRFAPGAGPELAPGTTWSWRTFGLRVTTRVIAFEPERFLAWRGDAVYGRGVHTWTLLPTEGGCTVVTEEVQRGFVPSLLRWYLRPGLLRWHERWLEGLARRAGSQASPPPP